MELRFNLDLAFASISSERKRIGNSRVYAYISAFGGGMAGVEINTRKIVARLEREGRVNVGGGSHDVFKHPDKEKIVVVPRHREQKPGTARSIAKAAGWI